MTAPERWARVSSIAFQLEAGAVSVPVALETLLEVFDASADPVDDFEGVAVRRLLLSLQRAAGGAGGGLQAGVHRPA